jgi:hypothetical protein
MIAMQVFFGDGKFWTKVDYSSFFRTDRAILDFLYLNGSCSLITVHSYDYLFFAFKTLKSVLLVRLMPYLDA